MKVDLLRGRAEGSLRAIAPCGKELLLRGQNAIETGEQKRSALARILPERCNQFEGQMRGTDCAARAADLVEVREPIAEGTGVLIPCASRFLFSAVVVHKRI